MPDFENWINYFADELVIKHQNQQHIPKYQFDEEMLPETLIDMDDKKI